MASALRRFARGPLLKQGRNFTGNGTRFPRNKGNFGWTSVAVGVGIGIGGAAGAAILHKNNTMHVLAKTSDPMADLHLYWASGSPPCWRVMIALHEKGIKNYPNTLIAFDKKENKSEEVLKLNPRAQMPTMRFGDIPVNESMAAVDYIEHLHGGKGTPLYPKDDKNLAVVLQKKYEALNLHQKGMLELVFYSFGDGDKSKEVMEKKEQTLRSELQYWEGYLAKAPYVAGPDFSMADIIFFPHLAIFVRFGLQLSDKNFPNLKTYYDRMSQRPSVKATWPPHWLQKPSTSNVLKSV